VIDKDVPLLLAIAEAPEAEVRVGLGRLYWRAGDRDPAREHLMTAMAMYREMDMPFWLEQAEAAMGHS
jgi:Flp pilus assembly protein TadD